MKSCILVRYDEIGLKGANRGRFEDLLVNNIRLAFRADGLSVGPIERRYGRIIVSLKKGISSLKRIFGISSCSPALETVPDVESMADAALHLCELNDRVSFRVSCQRLDKTMSLTSRDVEHQLGAELVSRTNAEVDLTEFDFEVGVELINNKAYVFVDRSECFGGLPVGSEGTVLALIDNSASLLAALLMLQRGCNVIPVSFSEIQHPILAKYGALAPRLIKEGEIDFIAKDANAKAVVVGQLIDNVSDVKTSLVILRPLVGLSEKQVNEKLNEFLSA